ncbi:nitroreductase family deazaflavin-dependent oxidoreductase [Streptomyces sp. NPDC090022]|uniref:nitroreductase family deazaflavin-dependent oxidoreductase n=1 Tax=Streptomyces sp. NPDC090022 TaxID=3365920 RepID=UPI0038117AC8
MHSTDVDWDHPTDPRPGWQLDHVRSYVETGGTDGHIWHGVPTLLLTTVGRVSGRAVRTPLIYGEDEDRLLVVASNGGAPEHPAWYRNLLACPEIRVQVGAEVCAAKARTATPQERETYWGVMTGLWPQYDEYQERTDREIPLVIIERTPALAD